MSQTSTVNQPDVAQLRQANLPTASFPGGRDQAYRIFFTPELHARIWTHANENLAVEICGVLVGAWGRDEAGPFVNITEAIRGEAATSKFAEVTFTHETWAKINQEMDTRFTHLSIVGWYHTHPDFGIFLSDRDVFIQQHFFSNPGNVAYVVDPVRKIEGTFIWRSGKPALAEHYWIGDKVQIAGGPTCLESPAEKGTPADNAPTPAMAGRPAPRTSAEPEGSRLINSLTQILAYLALFLLGYLLAGRFTEMDRLRTEDDAVARAALLLGVKPGLREALDRYSNDLKGLTKDVDALAEAHKKAAGETMTEDQQAQWKAIQTGLKEGRIRLAELQTLYCLSPAENERLIQLTATGLANRLGNSNRFSNAQLVQLETNLEKALRQLLKQGLVPLEEDKPKDPPPNKEDKAADKK